MPRARRKRRAATPSAMASSPPGSPASGEAAEQGPALEVVELEQPFDHPHRFHALKEAYEPGKRRATNAYDDIVTKRRKIDPQLGVPPVWQSTSRTGRPRSPTPSSRAARTARTHAFVADMRARQGKGHARAPSPGPRGFADLPAEIRAIVFRHLLVHRKPILVLRGWRYVYPRGRPNLHTGLLSVCRAFYEQGLGILYGENTFRYRTRDPSDADEGTKKIMQRVYAEDGYALPVHKHGHLLRYVEIDVEANRMRDAANRRRVVEALARFVHGGGGRRGAAAIPAQLRTVTLEIYLETRRALLMETSPAVPGHDYPAVELFANHADVLGCLKRINCQFVRIIAHRPQDGGLYETVVDRRPYFTARNAAAAPAGAEDMWAGDAAMLTCRLKNAQQSRARLNNMAWWLGKLIKNPQHLLKKNTVFREYVPEPDEPDYQSLPSSPPRSRARAPKKPRESAPPAAGGGLTEEALECVAGPSNWAPLSGPEDDESLSDRVRRLMG